MGDVARDIYPGIPTTIKTMGVNISTIAYLRVLNVLIFEIGSSITLMVVEAQGIHSNPFEQRIYDDLTRSPAMICDDEMLQLDCYYIRWVNQSLSVTQILQF